nr:synphilin-1 isoform X1 [Oryctolagus cuniculus]XP_051700088.1 synphilin-1 isoform X1 [Oryctolagus cuniculus]XP_051700089.1 synphilin-1 isoform X1 [Oryctolagus cuniculus]XP_051700090.1 synphilin-1 isoform X1 [Oryctolagus cuniculus]XP_051700091.1 synphilin-1 isoform X1 [Oryctolagus cuniculus]XP_051700092.1 synphilin-1 isoform X1 [Oryctolagus cuniculus]XP_051700093.1 synphilin-1 isoform X1 [Oryctolagus cuniculus]XP_051700094.1 synphilin-1 isoform X1 [Oryctolagus cuniculus]XP_051700095.1 synp
MEAPEYLDLDEIDFSDDISYSVTSLKTIPELCRRCDSQNEDRSVSGSGWNCGVSTLITNTQKPTGIADVYSKFRPVKRVSPLKHQPETLDSNESDDQKNQKGDLQKGGDSDAGPQPEELGPEEGVGGLPGKGSEPSPALGELEHYDLDMDEILDVPYIKSNQQLASFSKVASDKRILGLCTTINGLATGKACCAGGAENPPPTTTPFCVLSPVKSPHLRKASTAIRDQHKLGPEESESAPALVSCVSAYEPETQSRDFPNKAFAEPHGGKAEKALPDCQLRAFRLPCSAAEATLEEQVNGVSWPTCQGPEEKTEHQKKVKSILNIVREGQISLLPHLAADNLDKIHDENGNNLLHIAASQGHAECLQHLTSLMGEDGLNERNAGKLTPAGLAIKNGQLECVRWMVSETEAIAELSCSRDFPSLIHYAGCYGQEKILLWLLQFMQEQGISLDEVDQDGNSAVHVASQHGFLGCIQTLVEYGANVTMQNHAGEKPSQSAERHGHTLCSRYLVVVETCMSLASQVVKLTKQLKEQTVERVTLQTQLQQLLEAQKTEGKSLPSSPSSPSSPASKTAQWKAPDTDEESAARTKPGIQEGIQVLGSLSAASRARAKAKDEDSDKILRQLLGKEISENVCTQEKLSLEFQDAQTSRNPKKIPAEKRELKLARLRQLMQRSLSESDTDPTNPEDPKSTPVRKSDRPRPQPIVESVEGAEGTESLHLMIKKHSLASGRRFPFGIKASRSLDGHSPSPTSESCEADLESQYPGPGSAPPSQAPGDPTQPSPDSPAAQKVATSPKSALKSPSSKRRTSQNLKLRVTFEEPVVQMEQTSPDPSGERDKDRGRTLPRTSPGSESGDQLKRPFGTFRSIMETLSGNQNNSNNYQVASQLKTSTLPLTSLGRKTTDAKGSPVSSAGKGKNKAGLFGSCVSLSSNTLTEEHLPGCARPNDISRKMKKSYSIKHIAEPEPEELFL